MDDLSWKSLLNWMLWGYHHFRKHPFDDPWKAVPVDRKVFFAKKGEKGAKIRWLFCSWCLKIQVKSVPNASLSQNVLTLEEILPNVAGKCQFLLGNRWCIAVNGRDPADLK